MAVLNLKRMTIHKNPGFNVNKKDIYTSKPGSMPTRFYTLA